MPRSSSRSRSRITLIAIAAVGVIAWGCDTTNPPERGALRGVVEAEGEALAGVTVELSGAASETGQTDQSGRYEFEEIPAGAYVVSIRNVPGDAAFPSSSRTAVVPASGSVTVDFRGNYIRTASITGAVTVRDQGLEGVTVALSGTELGTTLTDENGEFRFPALRAGPYQVEVASFPPTVDFPSPRTEVVLSTGQTYQATFEGVPELTASVAIRNLLRRTAEGGLEGVDPDDVSGRIEVSVSFDRGQDRPDSLLVLLGDEVVGRQYFSAGGTEGPRVVAAQQELIFPVNTAAFDEETGEPRFLNGERPLTVRLATREGGPSASVATIPLTLSNSDTFMARLEPARGPVVGDDGQSWIGGDLVLGLQPVVYTPGRQVTSVQVELRRRGGSQVARRSDAGTAPFEFTLSPDADDASSLAGYQTPVGSIDQLRVISAGYSQGGSVSGLPILAVDSLRIDQVPPAAPSFALPDQGSSSDCCRDSWIGEAFRFVDALGESSDSGVGGVTPSFRAGPSNRTDAELKGSPPVVGGDDLSESDGSSAYRAIVVLSDALGNERVVRLAATAANPFENERGGVFGVDRTSPSIALQTGSGSVGPRAIAPEPDAEWVLAATDLRSGVAGVPFRTTVQRYHPSLGSQPVCVFPGGDPCDPEPDGFARSIPNDRTGYFRLRSESLDRAGNRSLTLDAWALRDESDPEMISFEIPSIVTPGASMVVAGQARDNVDLHRGQAGIRFGPPESGGAALPFAPPARLGTPFGGTLTPEASFQIELPVVAGLESVTSGGAPSGSVEFASQAVGWAVDAAGRIGPLPVDFPDGSLLEARSFSVDARGSAEGVVRWELTAAEPRVCSPRVGPDGRPGECPEDAPPAIELTATAHGEGGVFEPTFEQVHLLVVVADDDVRWLSSTRQAELVQDGAGADGRAWSWVVGWAPDPWIPAGAQRLIAVGVDGDGGALRTLELESVEVVPAG